MLAKFPLFLALLFFIQLLLAYLLDLFFTVWIVIWSVQQQTADGLVIPTTTYELIRCPRNSINEHIDTNNCDNDGLNLIKDPMEQEREESEPEEHSKLVTIADSHEPEWSFYGFLVLNICLLLNCFWIRCCTVKKHIQVWLATTIDQNLNYASLLILMQSFKPCYFSQMIHERAILLIQSFWFSTITMTAKSFILSFFITGSLLAVVRHKLLAKFWLRFDREDDPREPFVIRWISTLFRLLNVVLFRNTRSGDRRRNHGVGASAENPRNLAQGAETGTEELLPGDDDEYETIEEFIDLNEDMDRMLIERLFAVPNLWLHTESLISNDYIEKLPVWSYEPSLVDCNQNLMIESSCQSSSSSSDDDSYFDSQDVRKEMRHTESSCSVSYFETETDVKKSNPESDSPKAAKKFIENIIMPKIQNRIRKPIRNNRSKIINRESSISSEQKSDSTSSSSSSSKPWWMIELHECTVCLDVYENEQPIMGLPCGHNYHHGCIGEWLSRGNHCCPICRWPSYRLRHPRQQQQLRSSS